MEGSSPDYRGTNEAAVPSKYPIPRWQTFALALVLCAAFLLRFYCLTCSSFWHDEGNTWALVQRSFGQITADAAADIHPPGYYWLLKMWSLVFGYSPYALRAFSALTGTLTVAVVYTIARAVVGRRSAVPLVAALLASLNPFQIFYSQEARMYSLLMLESTALVWVVLGHSKRRRAKTVGAGTWQTKIDIKYVDSIFIVSFVLLATAGLWTHYIFPVMLAAVGIAYLWVRRRDLYTIHHTPNALHPFLVANLLAFLLFFPWLPTAINRVLSWPAGGADVPALEGLRLALQSLAVGPIRSGPTLAWPWLLLVGLLPLIGLWRLRRNPAAIFLGLWFFAPVGLMFGLGLFSDSFLKFLLVASPAWCLLAAAAGKGAAGANSAGKNEFRMTVSRVGPYTTRAIQSASMLLAFLLAYTALPSYYADPTARDNYVGMAVTVAALGDPATATVILNAPGQADVWRIYDPGVPVLALPSQRPPDRANTEAELAAAVANRRQLFALFWATEQADPDGIVEGWLNLHAFKGLESWQGNVRFVHYSLPGQLVCEDLVPPVLFGATIQLRRVCLPPQRTAVAATSLPVSLHWQTDSPLDRRYKATLQLLDAQNQVVGQQDGEPGGGSLPTDGWQAGAEIIDKRGVFAPPGAPPIDYRLILALYDAETNQRLPVAAGDVLDLGSVRIVRPAHPLPVEIVDMRVPLDQPIGPLHLAGFSAYAKGFAHDPGRPLVSGELLHIALYWQAPAPLPADWPNDLAFTLTLGGEQITAPLAGAGFPTQDWQAGDFVRGDVDIPYRSDGPLILSINGTQRQLGWIKNGQLH